MQALTAIYLLLCCDPLLVPLSPSWVMDVSKGFVASIYASGPEKLDMGKTYDMQQI